MYLNSEFWWINNIIFLWAMEKIDNMKSRFGLLLRTVLLLAISSIVSSQNIIKILPGFHGDLPFKLETGYVGVGEKDEIQLFYYFIESEKSPEDDPLVLWLTGGPGCSALSGLIYEIGPLSFDYEMASWNSTTLIYNPYSWTKVANIIFLDGPVGTGFSYATTWQAYNTSDTLSATTNYDFLRKWLMTHPKFLKNPLYIAGDSYSGIIVPILVQDIANGNEAGVEPSMNLKGYILGNPVTYLHDDVNSKVEFSYRKALISDQLYKSIKTNCNGEDVNIDQENALCNKDMEAFHECTDKLSTAHILEPTCPVHASPKPKVFLKSWSPITTFTEDSIHLLLSVSQLHNQPSMCRDYHYLYSYAWVNNQSVQDALQIRKGSKQGWTRCNLTIPYVHDVTSSVDYHQNLKNKGYRVLVYSGDQDFIIPYVGTLAWIEALNLTVGLAWTPWFVDGQVAGYTVQYYTDNGQLTFATVKARTHQ
nr:serine carboxypeptidase-like 8 [Ziziphus jujuba var. spinosa]